MRKRKQEEKALRTPNRYQHTEKDRKASWDTGCSSIWCSAALGVLHNSNALDTCSDKNVGQKDEDVVLLSVREIKQRAQNEQRSVISHSAGFHAPHALSESLTALKQSTAALLSVQWKVSGLLHIWEQDTTPHFHPCAHTVCVQAQSHSHRTRAPCEKLRVLLWSKSSGQAQK